MYKLYVNGKFNDSFISLEVVLQAAKKYLKNGEDIEIRINQPSFSTYLTQELPSYALPN
jgi:predicted rRNA methylase YqxC with S4 and FtsJ domains